MLNPEKLPYKRDDDSFLEEIEKNIRFQLKMIHLDSVQDTMTVSVAKASPAM